ncbi:MAG: transposase [Thermoproteota archaeon]
MNGKRWTRSTTIVYNIGHHFIWRPKYRCRVLVGEIHEFPSLKSRLPSMWTRSYYCESVGHISEDAIRKYIEEQKNK